VLESRVAALQLDRTVRFEGIRRDVLSVLPAFDAYLCSSRYEGVSLSLLEAMSCARPVVATSVGGNPEVLQHGHAGVLVPTEDANAMAAALIGLATNLEHGRRLGQHARDVVSTSFSLSRMLRDYVRIYSSLTQSDDGYGWPEFDRPSVEHRGVPVRELEEVK
jgi:glycosyltransferase involved in cell wall biosynthesis